ncbi:MAG: hypothetical protein HY096_08455 [Nitrospinae bacterium]|nr:hypothetical protein [Nitrospinota bacterium]
MAKWEGWEKIDEGTEVPIVFVMNMDIAKSKALASATHPKEHQEKINVFQREVQNILNDDLFYSDRWSGDGLVVLYKHQEAEADDLIKRAVNIIDSIREKNVKNHFATPVGLRIGIAVGTIIFQKEIGGIMSDVMNKAGLFQKSCPGTGGIFMTDSVLRFIKNSALKENFKPSLFMIGQEIRSVYYYPQLSSDEIPPFITSTGVASSTMKCNTWEAERRNAILSVYDKTIQSPNLV